MADTVTVHIDGLRELGEAMRELSADVANKVARQATGSAAQVIKALAKRQLASNPSIDSGLLRDNVIAKKLPKSQLTSEHIVTVRKRDYPKQRGKVRRNTKQVAIYLEFGTVKMRAEPFLRPAFYNGKERAVQVMIDRLKSRLEAVRPK